MQAFLGCELEASLLGDGDEIAKAPELRGFPYISPYISWACPPRYKVLPIAAIEA